MNQRGSSLSVLGWIVRDTIGKGSFTGAEVGLFNRVSQGCIDHPLLRITADTSVPAFTAKTLEEWKRGGRDGV